MNQDMQHIIQWAISLLKNHWYEIREDTTPENVVSTPYSCVMKFSTDQGFVYLKITPPALALESAVIKILHEQCHADVPVIIADNPKEHYFLMKDAGIRLHDFFKKEKFQAELFVDTIQNYTNMQIDTADKITQFLDIGVPDWRPNQLPNLYQALISQENLLLDDGLTKIEIKKLHDLQPKVSEIFDQLSQYNIPETFGHGDFHDKNILINPDTHKTTIIDLGEVVITHPFFSLHNCLHMAKENFLLPDDQYRKLQEACFKNWLAFESPKRLFEIIKIIERCWSIHSVLGEYRLMQSVDPISFKKLKREGRISRNLRYWIEANGTKR